MELCQYFLPYRECSLPDILANTTGLVLAAAAVLAFRQTRLYRMLFQLGGF
jgi:VanZ family protein